MGNILYSSETENVFPLKIRKTKKYGWIPDLPDQRDKYVRWSPKQVLKDSVDLREYMPKIYDQGDLGSCTANALSAAFEYDNIVQKLEEFVPSRLFVYYNERLVEGHINTDSGASLRDGIKTINSIGICPEIDYPYIIESFAAHPSLTAYKNASSHKTLEYRRVDVNPESLMKSLSIGLPVIFGFTVYESFETDEVTTGGLMPMPKIDEKILGGHAVLAVGYDSDNETIIIRNSWGTEWGLGGYFTMPYEFFCDKYCSNAWVIKSVNGVEDKKLGHPFI